MQSKTLDPAEYIEQMALLLDLQLDPEHRPAVVENFARIMAYTCRNFGLGIPSMRLTEGLSVTCNTEAQH